jgi:hypothetical protein
MQFTQDVELAFKQLCLTKRVNFICNSDEVGSIEVEYGSKYYVKFLGTKLKNPPMMYGHHRIIEFMRNHTPKMTFAVDDGIDNEAVVEPPSDYSVNTDMKLQWRSIKDPIKLSDIRTGECGNTIVLLIAHTEFDNVSHPDYREFEYMSGKFNNHTRVEIERVGYIDVGQAVSPFATTEEKEMYVRHLNNQFNKLIEDRYRDANILNAKCKPGMFAEDESGKTQAINEGNRAYVWCHYTNIVGWMMEHEFDEILNKAFFSKTNYTDIALNHFSWIMNFGCKPIKNVWNIHNDE